MNSSSKTKGVSVTSQLGFVRGGPDRQANHDGRPMEPI